MLLLILILTVNVNACLCGCSLKNNRIVGEDEQAVQKLLEERNYISEQRDRIYEHRPQSTVGVPLAPDEEDEEKQANSSLQDAPRVLKMFVL